MTSRLTPSREEILPPLGVLVLGRFNLNLSIGLSLYFDIADFHRSTNGHATIYKHKRSIHDAVVQHRRLRDDISAADFATKGNLP